MKKDAIIALVFGVFIFGIIAKACDSNDSKSYSGQTAVAKANTYQEDFAHWGKVIALTAVKLETKDPESVKVLSQQAEKIYPNDSTYGGKWLITATNSFGGRVQAYGVGVVHFKGGDITNSENWEVKTARIMDGE